MSSIPGHDDFSLILFYYFLHLKEICPCVPLPVLGMWGFEMKNEYIKYTSIISKRQDPYMHLSTKVVGRVKAGKKELMI